VRWLYRHMPVPPSGGAQAKREAALRWVEVIDLSERMRRVREQAYFEDAMRELARGA